MAFVHRDQLGVYVEGGERKRRRKEERRRERKTSFYIHNKLECPGTLLLQLTLT